MTVISPRSQGNEEGRLGAPSASHRSWPRNFRSQALTLLFTLTITALGGSCAEFDQPGALEDLRILGVRTEPAEILYSALYLFIDPEDRTPFIPIPEYEIDVEVFAFDPRGGRMQSTFQLCPEGRGVCEDYDPEERIVARFAADSERQAEVRDAYRIREQEHLPGTTPAGLLDNRRQTLQFTHAVMDSILRDARGNASISPFPVLPRIVVDYGVTEGPDGELDKEGANNERAYKRIPLSLNFNDPTIPPDVLRQLLDILGLKLCENPDIDLATFVEGETDCFLSRPANSNPDLIGFNIINTQDEEALLDEAETIEEFEAVRPPIFFANQSLLQPRSALRVQAGSEIRFRPVFTPGTREPYQVFSFDLDAQSLTLENRFEDIVISWYTTHGGAPDLTDTQLGGNLDAVFTAPSQGAINQIRTDRGLSVDDPIRDSLVAVVRDQRGGMAYAQIDIEYREEAPALIVPDGDDEPGPFDLILGGN